MILYCASDTDKLDITFLLHSSLFLIHQMRGRVKKMKNKHKNQYYLGRGVRDNTITNVYTKAMMHVHRHQLSFISLSVIFQPL